MFCFSCGQELPDAARFCSNCGTNLRGVAVRPTTEIETKIETEVTTDRDPQTETEAKTAFESLPFEFDIIKHFRDELDYEYRRHVTDRLCDAADEAKLHYMVKLKDLDYVNTLNIKTVGDLVFFFKKINQRYPSLKPTTQILMELLFRVYLKR